MPQGHAKSSVPTSGHKIPLHQLAAAVLNLLHLRSKSPQLPTQLLEVGVCFFIIIISYLNNAKQSNA